MTYSTIDRARGRWREILPRLGIADRFLVNRHGPCPLCGGKDRFRFDDRDGSGSYYCGQCGPGPGMLLLRKLHGWDHRTACTAVDEIIGTGAPLAQVPTQAKDDTVERLAKVERTLASADDAGVVHRYLHGRGLSVVPGVLRGHRALPYVDGDGVYVGRLQAVLAPILAPDGTLVSAQRIYADRSLAERKKVLPPAGTIKGGAIRLFDVSDEIGVGEGVETCIAAHELFGLPTWATISADNLVLFDPPAGVTRVTVFGDNDENFVGQASAYALARRLALKGYDVAVEIPTTPGTDWLDALADRRLRGAA